MKPWPINRNNKSACVNIFSEVLLTGKFRQHLRMNWMNASHTIDHTLVFIHWLLIFILVFILIFILTFILVTILILLTLIIIQHALIVALYIDFCNSLQYSFFIFTNDSSILRNWNNRMTRETVSFEKVFNKTRFLAFERLFVICEISPKVRWNFTTQDFSQFTQEKHKNVVNLIIIYVAVRQSNLK